MRKQKPFNPEVDATEEVQGEIAEPIGDLPVYQSRSKRSKKKAVAATSDIPKKPRKKIRVKRILKWIALFSCSLSVAWSSCL